MGQIHIIAEAGNNHGGDVNVGKQLVDIAAESGADSVKFQIIYPEGLYLPDFYQDGRYVHNDVFDQRIKLMLRDEDYAELAKYCAGKGIGFSASVFDKRSTDLLDKLNADYFKIASCDLNNSYLLKLVAERGKKIILSTGMSQLGEIERAVNDIYKAGNHDIVLMHCVSVYPCLTENMNLGFLGVLRKAFGLPIGLSDHTENSLAAAIAVSKGVTWLEKHFTYNRQAEGFDHAYAMEPADFKVYIQDVRMADKACERRTDKLTDAETTVKSRARRGLFAARDIGCGEKIEFSDVLIVRPEGPLEPNQIDLILNRDIKRNIKKFEPFSLDMFM
ncbi:MAG: N-acetylneuraminate synthase family protein [Thermincola sp.]|nr:N-acetylneuraminate synthase family protein [Thermincola sp.]MDT3703378.1 N-acetylneuraminate synthase family protein [Thermincola sp.]